MNPYTRMIWEWLVKTRKDVETGIIVKRSKTKPTGGQSWLFGKKFRKYYEDRGYEVLDTEDFYLTIYEKTKE